MNVRLSLTRWLLLTAVVAVTALAGMPGVAQSVSEPTLAPQNQAFEQYLSNSYVSAEARPSSDPVAGLVPETIDFSYLNALPIATFQAASALPSSYDLRILNKLTPIRDQGACGSCWDFAAMGSLESSLMPGENSNFSENNLKNLAGFDLGCCDGGNRTMSTSYFARWAGPIAEIDDPYNTSNCASTIGLSPKKHVQEVIFLPNRTSSLDNDSIKQAVMTYGAVYSTYYHSDAYYRSSTAAYYSPSGTSTNHAIGIVGWDDNYPASNFLTAPPGNGAFLIRNSWGTWWGQSGYFWMSYYDSAIGRSENAVYRAEPNTNYDAIYQYDTLGWVSNSGYGSDTAWFANVFTAVSNSSIAAASWYAAAPNSSYVLYVYTNPTSGPLGSTPVATVTGTIGTTGYHTVQLPTAVPVTSGQKFSVVVKSTVPGYGYPIPLERPYSGYASGATASAGQSYISSNGTSWSDATSNWANTNVCLKAFTSSSGAPPPPGPGVLSVTPTTGLSASGMVGGPFSPSIQAYTLTNTGQSSLNWTANSSQSWISVSGSGGTLAAGATTTVTVSVNTSANTLAAGSYSGSASFANTSNGNGSTSKAVSLTVNAASPGALSVTPATTLTSSGTVGGPFGPSNQAYTLANTGSSSLSWTATKSQTWMTVSASSGTLAAGASTTVTVSINTSANTLAAGSYSGAASFANTTNGTGNTSRSVSLTVNAPSPGVLSVAPATTLASSGTVGGPFSPSSQVYTLTNTGKSSLSWTATKSQAWMSLSRSSGSLAAGATTTVTVSINTSANTLAAGSYSGSASFTNATNGSGNTSRAVTLTVNAVPGVLSVTPTTTFSPRGPVGGPFAPSSQVYTLTNTGKGPLTWTGSATSWLNLSSTGGTLAAGATSAVTVSVNTAANALAAGTWAGSATFVNVSNGNATIRRSVTLAVSAQAPPPAGNYLVAPTVYNWVDPSSHTAISLADDSVSTARAIPFAFSFYGKTYSSLYVGSNGLLSFTGVGAYSPYNTNIPSSGYPNAAIYPYWDNLKPVTGSSVRIGVVGSAPNRQLVVSWVGAQSAYSIYAQFTFQAILCEGTNDIVFQYLNVAPSVASYGAGQSATVGIENGLGSAACKFSYNTRALTNSMAIRFTTLPASGH